MILSPREKDKLLVSMAAMVARRRLARGVKLNPDGTKLVTVHQPVRGASHDAIIPGEIITEPGDIVMNEGRATLTITVANKGDRPIQVGSHYHFFETNPALSFDRTKTRGMRLDIPAGTAVRFEPGQTRDVTLVALAGKREVYGFRQDVMGAL